MSKETLIQSTRDRILRDLADRGLYHSDFDGETLKEIHDEIDGNLEMLFDNAWSAGSFHEFNKEGQTL